MRKILFTIALIMVAMIAPAQENPMEGLCFNPDKPAEFPGGKVAMGQYFSENLEYPTDALIEGIEGRVMCQFIIQPDSSRTNINIVRKVHPSIDAEMRRLVENMPQWTPATKDGIPVKTLVTLPLMFKLPENLQAVTENVVIFHNNCKYISTIREEKSNLLKIRTRKELTTDTLQEYITNFIAQKYKHLDTIISCQLTLNSDTTIKDIKLYQYYDVSKYLPKDFEQINYIRNYNTNISLSKEKGGGSLYTKQKHHKHHPIFSFLAPNKDITNTDHNPNETTDSIINDIKNLPKELFLSSSNNYQIYKEGDTIIKPQTTYYINLLCKDINKFSFSTFSVDDQLILTMRPSCHVNGKNLNEFIVDKYNNTAWVDKGGAAKIKFIVHKDGTLSSFETIEATNKEVSKNIINFIKETEKKWTPGIYKNKYVDCEYICDIVLKRQDKYNSLLNLNDFVVKVDDLNYALDLTEHTATAIGKNYNKQEVIIPANIKYNGIEYQVNSVNGFYKNTQLKSVILSEGITEIGVSAFEGCISLESITIPNSVFQICPEAFMNCKSLKTISFPKNLTHIYGGAFKGCSSLTSITLPENLDFLQNGIEGANDFGGYNSFNAIHHYWNIFEDCSSLEEVIFPEKITQIPDGMFKNCKSLKKIVLNDNNLKTVGANVFENTYFYNTQENGCVYLNNILIGYKGNMKINTHLEIKEGTKIIAQRVFENKESLSSITIPESITIIGDNAFRFCSSLKTITIPKSVKIIGTGCFRGCTSLKTIEFKSINPPTIYGIVHFPKVQLIIPAGSEAAYQEAFNSK